MVEDLRLLLKAAGFQPPYLLVGHSFGGLNMQLYARCFPSEVAGLVLVDSVHPDQIERFYTFSKSAGDGLLAETKDVLKGVDWEASAEQVRTAPALTPLPLVVITRGRETPEAQVWNELQADLAAQLSDSRQIIAQNSGHGIQMDEPQVVIAAIQEMVQHLHAVGRPLIQ
jgi:pimeloyl-ACP methyl ester carboxylesterase